MNKNSISKIIFIISVILVIVCIVMAVYDNFSNMYGSNDVEWNNMTFLIGNSMTYVESENSINFTGKYDAENVQIKLTNDTTLYNETVKADDMSIYSSPFNKTHTSIAVPNEKYIFIVPNDAFVKDISGNTVVAVDENIHALKGDATLLEVTGSNFEFIQSFILQAGGV